jgi:hypothetical protein
MSHQVTLTQSPQTYRIQDADPPLVYSDANLHRLNIPPLVSVYRPAPILPLLSPASPKYTILFWICRTSTPGATRDLPTQSQNYSPHYH